jgi:hypothetical protein
LRNRQKTTGYCRPTGNFLAGGQGLSTIFPGSGFAFKGKESANGLAAFFTGNSEAAGSIFLSSGKKAGQIV